MDNHKNISNIMILSIFRIAKIAAKLGKQEKLKVYIVGGVVRDIILVKNSGY